MQPRNVPTFVKLQRRMVWQSRPASMPGATDCAWVVAETAASESAATADANTRFMPRVMPRPRRAARQAAIWAALWPHTKAAAMDATHRPVEFLRSTADCGKNTTSRRSPTYGCTAAM